MTKGRVSLRHAGTKNFAHGGSALRREEIGEPRQGLFETLVGAVVLDGAVARGSRLEIAAPGDAGAAAEILEHDGLPELHGLDVAAAAVAIDDALRRLHHLEGD